MLPAAVDRNAEFWKVHDGGSADCFQPSRPAGPLKTRFGRSSMRMSEIIRRLNFIRPANQVSSSTAWSDTEASWPRTTSPFIRLIEAWWPASDTGCSAVKDSSRTLDRMNGTGFSRRGDFQMSRSGVRASSEPESRSLLAKRTVESGSSAMAAEEMTAAAAAAARGNFMAWVWLPVSARRAPRRTPRRGRFPAGRAAGGARSPCPP